MKNWCREMKFFTWNNINLTDADLFVRIEEDEIENLKSSFPQISESCVEFDDAYFGFVDSKKKTFTPLRTVAFAFGGQYNDCPPYGDEVKDVGIDLKSLSWNPCLEIEKDWI